MAYQIVTSDGVVAATGEGIVVAFDYGTQTKIDLPPVVREAIRRIDGI